MSQNKAARGKWQIELASYSKLDSQLREKEARLQTGYKEQQYICYDCLAALPVSLERGACFQPKGTDDGVLYRGKKR